MPVVGSSRKTSSGRPCTPERDGQPPALTAGEPADAGAGLLAQADRLDQLGGRPGRGVVAGEVVEDLPHGELLRGPLPLADHADPRAPVPAGSRRVLAEHAHLAAVPPPDPLEDLDGRRLARAVGAEQGEDLAAAPRRGPGPSTTARPP